MHNGNVHCEAWLERSTRPPRLFDQSGASHKGIRSDLNSGLRTIHRRSWRMRNRRKESTLALVKGQ